MSVWSQKQQRLIEVIHQEDRSVRLAGDARCCSPGHTAKFRSYSMLDLDTGKILDFKLVQGMAQFSELKETSYSPSNVIIKHTHNFAFFRNTN